MNARMLSAVDPRFLALQMGTAELKLEILHLLGHLRGQLHQQGVDLEMERVSSCNYVSDIIISSKLSIYEYLNKC